MNFFLGVNVFGLGLGLGLATWGCDWGLALPVLCLGLAIGGPPCVDGRLACGWALLVGVGCMGQGMAGSGLGTALFRFGVGKALS